MSATGRIAPSVHSTCEIATRRVRDDSAAAIASRVGSTRWITTPCRRASSSSGAVRPGCSCVVVTTSSPAVQSSAPDDGVAAVGGAVVEGDLLGRRAGRGGERGARAIGQPAPRGVAARADAAPDVGLLEMSAHRVGGGTGQRAERTGVEVRVHGRGRQIAAQTGQVDHGRQGNVPGDAPVPPPLHGPGRAPARPVRGRPPRRDRRAGAGARRASPLLERRRPGGVRRLPGPRRLGRAGPARAPRRLRVHPRRRHRGRLRPRSRAACAGASPRWPARSNRKTSTSPCRISTPRSGSPTTATSPCS